MIEIRNISKKFTHKKKTFLAINQVSLKVQKGEILGVIGSSGAGKSTLIRCINFLEHPDEGIVLVNGLDLNTLSRKKLASERKKIGMIFQHFNLMSSRTVFENVAFPLELDGMSKEKIRSRVQELLQMVGIIDKAHEYPNNLSGGQMQRVAIARALANQPHILLCDEATSALDPSTTQSILQLLRKINEELKITIVLITHQMEVVKSICHQIAVMNNGQIIAKGTLGQLLSAKEKVLANFIQDASITLPQEIAKKINNSEDKTRDFLLEVSFNGTFLFDEINQMILINKLRYQLLIADIDFVEDKNFGRVVIQLSGELLAKQQLMEYLSENSITYKHLGYV